MSITVDMNDPREASHSAEASREDIVAAGFADKDDLDNPKTVGVFILTPPTASVAEAVEAGIFIGLIDDSYDVTECPDEPHEHPERRKIATGRISYAKALSLASALIEAVSRISPLDTMETKVVERLNARRIRELDEMRAAMGKMTDTEAHGGAPFNII